MGIQTRTKNLSGLVGQLDLLSDPEASGSGQTVDPTVVFKQPTLTAAVLLMVQVAGFRYEKQFYKPLGIDAGNWTRIKQGEMSFPLDRLMDAMELCRSDIPLLWQAHRRGKGLFDLEDTKDRTIREQAELIQRLQQEFETLEKYGVLNRTRERS